MPDLDTVLFTDVVSSTTLVSQLGDRRWSALMARHDAISEAAVRELGGSVVKFTGDGVLALFASPGPALTCAPRLRREIGHLGLPLRCGLATGPVIRRGDDISGVVVHLAQRVQACAAPEQILATVDTVSQPDGEAPDHRYAGNRHLNGFPDEVHLVEIDPPPVRDEARGTAIVIDDHPSFRRSVRALVESEGIEVLATAADGDEGLSMAAELRPDLVLIDVQLPGIDGIEVAAGLHGLDYSPVVVLVSARDRSAYGSRIGDTVYITKSQLGTTSFRDLLGSGRTS